MSDQPVPSWRKVLISGSNIHVHEVTSSGISAAVSNPTIQKVLVYDTNSGAFYYTGSYGTGGSSGGGTPANPDKSVQFNNNGSFGGDGGFVFDSTQDASLYVSGAITGSVLVAQDTDGSPVANISLKDADGNGIAQFARVGSGVNAHVGRMVLRDNSTIMTQFTAGTSLNFISNSNGDAKLGINESNPGKALTVNGDISASDDLYASTSYAAEGDYNNVVLYDTTSGKFYHTGSYGTGTGTGTPSGNNKNIQFNNNGAFGGSDDFIFDNSTATDVKTILQGGSGAGNSATIRITGSNQGGARLELHSAAPRIELTKTDTGGTEIGNVYLQIKGSTSVLSIDNDAAGSSGIEFNVEGGANSIKAKLLNSTTVTSETVSSSVYTASAIYAAGMGTGIDNSVVIKDADGVLKTDEIDSRVWGSTLVDAVNGSSNRIATFDDANTINGESNLTFDGTNLVFGSGKVGNSAITPAIGNSTGKAGLTGGTLYDLDYWDQYGSINAANQYHQGEYLRGLSTSGKIGYAAPVSLGKTGVWEACDATGKNGRPDGIVAMFCSVTSTTQDNLALTRGYAYIPTSIIGGSVAWPLSLYIGTASGFYQTSAPGGKGTTARKMGTIITTDTGKAGTYALVKFSPSEDFIIN
jgi:hypothetical protein